MKAKGERNECARRTPDYILYYFSISNFDSRFEGRMPSNETVANGLSVLKVINV